MILFFSLFKSSTFQHEISLHAIHVYPTHHPRQNGRKPVQDTNRYEDLIINEIVFPDSITTTWDGKPAIFLALLRLTIPHSKCLQTRFSCRHGRSFPTEERYPGDNRSAGMYHQPKFVSIDWVQRISNSSRFPNNFAITYTAPTSGSL